jgi:AcrR family transcriptional regulator
MPKILSEIEIADFRERLCEAATRLFAERGREGFTMRELAGELGVSPMTPYRYFRDKDAILAAVRARAFDRFAEELETAFAKSGNAATKSLAVCDGYVRFALSESAAYRLMFDIVQPDEGDYPDLVRALTRARATMTDHVRGLVKEKILEGDANLIGHVFWSALHGMMMLELSGKLAPNCDFEIVRRETFRALIEGFRAKH